MIVTRHHNTQILAREIHVWIARTDHPDMTAEYFTYLDEAERERAARLVFEHHRSRFIQSHGILRLILSGYLGIEPSKLTFSHGQHGKPTLIRSPDQPPLEFSLSHSADYCAIAVGLGMPLGIDLEKIRDVPQMAHVAERHFTPSEFQRFASLTGVARQNDFFALWTRKEAIVKALGHGLGGNPDELTFDVEGAAAARDLSVVQLSSLPGYFAAVATLQPDALVMEYSWQDVRPPTATFLPT